MNLMKFCTGIVTFNPNIERLRLNLEGVYSQSSLIVVVDNHSQNIKEIEELIDDFPRVYIIYNEKNYGIARALNQIMEFAKKNNLDWALLLDQDSIIPGNMINNYTQLTDIEGVAIVCPRVQDNNSNRIGKADSRIELVGLCITSGSLNNVKTWENIGKFDESLFIDYVDNEYCIRLYYEGFRIIRDNEVILNHELGKTEYHLFKSTTNHGALRRYYIARNSYYVARKYKYIFNNSNINYKEANIFLDKMLNPTWAFLRQLQFCLLIVLYENNKINKIYSIFKGLRDGNKLYKQFLRTL